MEQSKEILFIDKLCSETMQSHIRWERATKFEGLQYNSRPELGRVFLENEWRHIDYYRSFTAMISNGFVYMIDVSAESGRDGSQSKYYEFFVEDRNDLIFPMTIDQGQLHRLANAIKSYLAEQEAPAEKFVDDYLNS